MKMFPLAALSLLLAACSSVEPAPMIAPSSGPPAVTTVPLESVTFEKRSWGNLLHRWTVDAAGQVEHVRDEAPFGGQQAAGYELRRATLTGEQRAALVAALARVEQARARPEACKKRMTDGPYGKISWSKGLLDVAFDWSGNCVEGRDAELAAAISSLDKIVDDAALATPPIQTVPEEEGGKGR